MGRYSSDSEEEYRRSKKKKKRRSRSRSRSSSYSNSRKRKSKKKSKKKSFSRSRSRSSEYRRRRSRSKSGERYRRRRSRSGSYSRRRSRSRDRRSSSRPKSYRRSRSRSGSKSRKSSRSRRYSRSRSASREKSYRRGKSRSRSRSVEIQKDFKDEPTDPAKAIPGFDELSLSEQNELRMQMALKAAAATDERLRKEGLLPSNVGRPLMTVEEQARRIQAINDMEAEAFVQQTFTSSRGVEKPLETSTAPTHENAIFSNVPITLGPGDKKTIVYKDADSLMHPNLYENPDVKMDRWILKLTAMRKKKLEGEAMT